MRRPFSPFYKGDCSDFVYLGNFLPFVKGVARSAEGFNGSKVVNDSLLITAYIKSSGAK
jgi:hypothetical protein